MYRLRNDRSKPQATQLHVWSIITIPISPFIILYYHTHVTMPWKSTPFLHLYLHILQPPTNPFLTLHLYHLAYPWTTPLNLSLSLYPWLHFKSIPLIFAWPCMATSPFMSIIHIITSTFITPICYRSFHLSFPLYPFLSRYSATHPTNQYPCIH